MIARFVIDQLVNWQKVESHHKSDEKSSLKQALASVAHSAEQLIRNQQVRGSTPRAGSIHYSGLGVKMTLRPLFCVKRAFLAYLEHGSGIAFRAYFEHVRVFSPRGVEI